MIGGAWVELLFADNWGEGIVFALIGLWTLFPTMAFWLFVWVFLLSGDSEYDDHDLDED